MKASNETAVKTYSTTSGTRVLTTVSLGLTLMSLSLTTLAPAQALEIKTLKSGQYRPTLSASQDQPDNSKLSILKGAVVDSAPKVDGTIKADSSKADTTGSETPIALHDPADTEAGIDKAALAKCIPNFALVNPHIWRGGAPGKAGVESLAHNGVKTIIDLRLTGVGTLAEEAEAKALGINYVHIPMTFNCPPIGTVAQFMHVATNPLNQPVYVHCRQGADRTGTLIGIMRITQDHWSYRQAYSEMRAHHFKPFFTNLSKMVANYENNRSSQRQLAQATQAIQ